MPCLYSNTASVDPQADIHKLVKRKFKQSPATQAETRDCATLIGRELLAKVPRSDARRNHGLSGNESLRGEAVSRQEKPIAGPYSWLFVRREIKPCLRPRRMNRAVRTRSLPPPSTNGTPTTRLSPIIIVQTLLVFRRWNFTSAL